MASVDLLRRNIEKTSRCRTHHHKEKWTRAHFNKFTMGTDFVSASKFRMALTELDLGTAYANQLFSDLSEGDKLKVDRIISALFGEAEQADMFGVGSRYISSHENPRDQPKPDKKQQKVRQFWDLVGNRAIQKKQYRSVRDVILAMDKDGDGTLSQDEARVFFSKFFATSYAQVDEWFELLDTNANGDLDLKDFARQLEPYFQKSFGNPAEEIAEWVAREKEDPRVAAQREIGKLWKLIGQRAQEKGFPSVRKLLATLDLDDSGTVDREEVRTWFDRYLNFPQHSADRFFDLLDPNLTGELKVAEMRKHLEPYFQKTFQTETQFQQDYIFENEEDPDTIRQRNIKAMFDEIGTRAFQKGFKNERQLMLAMDKDDGGFLDRRETQEFFRTYLGYYTNDKADRFFDLLDTKDCGQIDTREIKYFLAPYFSNNFRDENRTTQDFDVDRFSEDHFSDRGDRASEASASSYRPRGEPRGFASTMRSAVDQRLAPEPEILEQDDEFSAMVISQFRKKVSAAGGIEGLQKALSPHGSKPITPDELYKALGKLGLRMKANECSMVFNAIDQHDQGRLPVNQVLQAVASAR